MLIIGCGNGAKNIARELENIPVIILDSLERAREMCTTLAAQLKEKDNRRLINEVFTTFVFGALGGDFSNELFRTLSETFFIENIRCVWYLIMPFSVETFRYKSAQITLESIENYLYSYTIVESDTIKEKYSYIQFLRIPRIHSKNIDEILRCILKTRAPIRGRFYFGVGNSSNIDRVQSALSQALESPWFRLERNVAVYARGNVDRAELEFTLKSMHIDAPTYIAVERCEGNNLWITLISWK